MDLKGDKNRKTRFELLFKYALNSPLKEIYKLKEKYPLFEDVFSEVISKVALVVRFPKYHRAEVNKSFEERKEYLALSEKYAAGNLEYIRGVIPRMSKMTREELLDDIVKNRITR